MFVFLQGSGLLCKWSCSWCQVILAVVPWTSFSPPGAWWTQSIDPWGIGTDLMSGLFAYEKPCCILSSQSTNYQLIQKKTPSCMCQGGWLQNVWRTLGYSHFKYKICSSTPDGNSQLDHDLSPRYYLIFQECSQFDKFSRTQNKREIMCNGFSWGVMINNDCWVNFLQNLSIDKLGGGTSRHVHSESVVIQCPFSSLQPLRNFWLA